MVQLFRKGKKTKRSLQNSDIEVDYAESQANEKSFLHKAAPVRKQIAEAENLNTPFNEKTLKAIQQRFESLVERHDNCAPLEDILNMPELCFNPYVELVFDYYRKQRLKQMSAAKYAKGANQMNKARGKTPTRFTEKEISTINGGGDKHERVREQETKSGEIPGNLKVAFTSEMRGDDTVTEIDPEATATETKKAKSSEKYEEAGMSSDENEQQDLAEHPSSTQRHTNVDHGENVVIQNTYPRQFELLEGRVDYDLLIRSLSLFHKGTPREIKLKVAFNVFDSEGDGYVGIEDMVDVWRVVFPRLSRHILQEQAKQVFALYTSEEKAEYSEPSGDESDSAEVEEDHVQSYGLDFELFCSVAGICSVERYFTIHF